MFKSLRFKKLTSAFTVLLMVLSVVMPFNVFAEDTNDGQAKNLISEDVVKAGDGTVEIQILATSDVHGRFVPYDYAVNAADMQGSLSQILTAVRKFRGENPNNTILVDAGDTVQDNSASLFLNDEINPMILAMNEMGYDTWTLGNHEFNHGVPTLEKVMKQFKGEILCGNVYKPDGERLAAPYTIVERSGVKVGIIGMVTPNITRWDSANLEGYKVTNPIDETRAAIDEIKDKVDIIIAVDHMGEESEYGTAGSGLKEIAEACPELTAIVGGHAHSKIKGDYYYNGEIIKEQDATEEVKNNGILIVEPYKWGQALGQIKITLTEKDGKYVVENKAANIVTDLHFMSGKYGNPVNYESDEELSEKLESYNKRAIDDANIVIGELKGGDLVPAEEVKGIPTAQVQQTAMIDLINDVQMHYGKVVAGGHDIDVSAAASFKSTANIKEGQIRKCDMANIYKFDNSLYVLKVTGKQLKKYMEWSASYYNTYKDGDLTISFNPNVRGYNYDMFSGVKYEIDLTKPAGQRIVNLTKNNEEVKDTDELYLTVNNYRATSHLLKSGAVFEEGEELPVFVGKSDDPTFGLGDGRIRDLIGKYIVEEKGGVITPEVKDNWKVVGNNWDDQEREEAVKLINEGKIEIPRSEDGRTPNVAAVNHYDLLKAKGMKQVDVVFFNDFHGSVEESGKNQGIAKVAGAINEKKAENPNTIVVAAGDNFQGSAMSNLTYGAPVNEFMKSVGVVASAVGNHEFDWGIEKIENWAEEGGYDFLASNIYDKATGEPVKWAKPYKIVEKDGIKVGFIGLATPETAFKTKAEHVESVEFRNPVKAAEEWTKVARENGADVVIALTHLGSKQDYETKEITGEVVELTTIEGLDAIISSHTHQKVCGTVNGVPVVQPYKQGRALGSLSIIIDENGKVSEVKPAIDYLYKRSETIEEDAEVKAIVDKYEEEVGPLLSEVIGTTDKELSHDRTTGPSILGEWVCDVMREKAGTQIAVTNGGGLRCPIPAGEITVGKLYEVMPFDNTLVKMELKGSDVKSVIEHGIMNDVIGWVQISGVNVRYNNEGKITSIALEDGTPLDMDKYYTVVTNDFQFTGGDGFDFSGAKNDVNMMIPIRDALIEAVKAEKNLSIEKRNCLAQGEESNKNSVYVVKFGDTLGNIAAKFNTTYEEIAKANNVENVTLIFPGDKLIIPGNDTIEVENVYTVADGDTLGKIAEMFGMKYEDLAKYNNIENPSLIFAGQKISIPAN